MMAPLKLPALLNRTGKPPLLPGMADRPLHRGGRRRFICAAYSFLALSACALKQRRSSGPMRARSLILHR